MISSAQNLRHFKAFPLVRPGVLGIFQKPVPMTLAGIAFLIRKDARNQAADGIGYRHSCNLSPSQHKIAERELFIDTFFNKTLVNALIVPTYKNKMVIVTAETLGCLLGEGFSLR